MVKNNPKDAGNAGSYKSTVKTRFSYDGIFKRFIETLSDEVIKKFLLYLFGLEDKIDFSEKLERLQQETHNNGKKRVSDLFYKIGSRYFCIEIQTTNDKQMALRVFEYSFREALLHGIKESSAGDVTIDFPRPAVIYLRSTKATPDKINVRLNFPDITVFYNAAVKKLSDYTVEDLFKQYAYPLMSFYPLNYEKDLHKKHTTELERDFIEDINQIIAKIGKSVKNGILDPTAAQILINSLRSFMNMVSENGDLITDKEVLNNMRQVDTIEIVDVVQIKEDGIKIGEANERKKLIMNLYANDFEPLEISKLLSIPKEEVDKIISGVTSN